MGALDLALFPPTVLLGIVGGAAAVGCLAVPCLTLRAVRLGVPDHAGVAPDPVRRHAAARFFVGDADWASRRRAAPWVARWGPAVRGYREEAAWYGAVEYAAGFAVSAIQVLPPETQAGCGHQKLATAAVCAALVGLEMWVRPQLHPRNRVLSVLANAMQAAAMGAFAAAYYGGRGNGDGRFAAALHLLCASVYVLAAKAALDLLAAALKACTGQRRAVQAAAFGAGGGASNACDMTALPSGGCTSTCPSYEGLGPLGLSLGSLYAVPEARATDVASSDAQQPLDVRIGSPQSLSLVFGAAATPEPLKRQCTLHAPPSARCLSLPPPERAAPQTLRSPMAAAASGSCTPRLPLRRGKLPGSVLTGLDTPRNPSSLALAAAPDWTPPSPAAGFRSRLCVNASVPSMSACELANAVGKREVLPGTPLLEQASRRDAPRAGLNTSLSRGLEAAGLPAAPPPRTNTAPGAASVSFADARRTRARTVTCNTETGRAPFPPGSAGCEAALPASRTLLGGAPPTPRPLMTPRAALSAHQSLLLSDL
eukprot:TRINITY_DN13121_c0_g1_i1.p1 TRINITY_DN13121_c0_g1~~TRINITY_DN13121_c0_g1_i1.p1  ORF type:complete len:566 (+),score=73.88 TRINITY_DN13121_c0_g1_i1:83-1699(+)